jgi:hypothetical protein
VARGDEAFEGTVKSAVAALEGDAKPTAARHLQFAIAALSARPKADTSGAVAHATSAVECLLNVITGEALTLGKYLDRHPDLFHPALKKGLDGIYGYASDEGPSRRAKTPSLWWLPAQPFALCLLRSTSPSRTEPEKTMALPLSPGK